VLFNVFSGLDSLIEDGKSIGDIILLGVAKFLISMVGSVIIGFLISSLFCFLTKYTSRIS